MEVATSEELERKGLSWPGGWTAGPDATERGAAPPPGTPQLSLNSCHHKVQACFSSIKGAAWGVEASPEPWATPQPMGAPLSEVVPGGGKKSAGHMI